MKIKDVVTDTFSLWCIRIILGCVAGILLVFLIVKVEQLYYTSKMMHQVSEATDAYYESEIKNLW